MIIIAYAINSAGILLTFANVSLFLLTFLSGIIICFSLLSLIGTLGFWTYTSALYDLVNTTLSVSRYPTDIFPRAAVFALTVIPLIFIATGPAKTLIGKTDLLTWLSPFLAVGIFVLARKFLFYALGTYTSASS